MKTVWILNHYAREPSCPGGTRHFGLARHLCRHGWHGVIIASSIGSEKEEQKLPRGVNRRLDNFDGVSFLWVRAPEYSGNGVLRLINMLVFSIRVLMPSITSDLLRPDVIVGSSVHPFAAVAGAILARRFKVPFIFEVRDLWPKTLVEFGRLSERGLLAAFLRQVESWLYRRADRILTLLPGAKRYIVPLGIEEEKIIWLPNGVELNDVPMPAQAERSTRFILMYFGAHGQANGLDVLIHAMDELRGQSEFSRLHLKLVGDGPMKSDLIELAAKLELDNVEFCDPVPKNHIPVLAAEADAFVLCVRDLPGLYQYGISPNKLFDYFAAARPIIFSSGAPFDLVVEARAGISVPPGDPHALALGLDKVIHMPLNERIAMGEAGRAFVEKNYSYEALAARFASTLDQLVP